MPEQDGIFLSTNDGALWSDITNDINNTHITSMAVSGTNIFAGTYYGGIFKSTNYGINWIDISNGLPNPGVESIAVYGSNIFVGVDASSNGGIFLSTNNGTNWTYLGLEYSKLLELV